MRAATLEDRLRHELQEVQRLTAQADEAARRWFADPDVWWPGRSGESIPSAVRRSAGRSDPTAVTAARVAGERRRDLQDVRQAAELLATVAGRLAS